MDKNIHANKNCTPGEIISGTLRSISAIPNKDIDEKKLELLRSLFVNLETSLKKCSENRKTGVYDKRDCVLEITGLYYQHNRKVPESCCSCLKTVSEIDTIEEVEGISYPFYYSWNW